MRRSTTSRIEQFQAEHAWNRCIWAVVRPRLGPATKDVLEPLQLTRPSRPVRSGLGRVRQRIVRLPSEGRAHEPWCCGEVEAGFLLSQKRKVGVCSHHAKNVAGRQTTWQRAWSLTYGAASRIRQQSCIAVSSHFAACKAVPNCGALAGTGAVGHMSSRRRYPRCRIVEQGPWSTRPVRAGLPRGAVVLCGSKCLVPTEWYGAMCCAIQFQQASCYSAGCPAVTADWVEQRPHRFWCSTRESAQVEWLDGMSLRCQREQN
jgi:hypothetical protein